MVTIEENVRVRTLREIVKDMVGKARAEGLQPSLAGMDLRGADLAHLDLALVNLRGADLRDADLQGANLRGADLAGANFEGAVYANVDFRDTVYDYTSHYKEPNPVDYVNHPPHYTRYKGVEVITLTEQMNFNRGNAVKYICRAGHKDGSDELEDLRKAVWYLQREINRIS